MEMELSKMELESSWFDWAIILAYGILSLVIGVFIGGVANSTHFPKHPEFTRHIDNVAAVKFMTPDRQYYYAVEEKIGNQTHKVILKPILTLDAEDDNNKSSDADL